MDDQIYATHFLLMNDNLEGAFNLVAPNAVTQKTFANQLGKVLRRPAFMPTPPLGIWLLFGKMGVALTTESTRVNPTKLSDAGYRFEHENLEPALRDCLGIW